MHNRSDSRWPVLPVLACLAFTVAACQKTGATATGAAIARAGEPVAATRHAAPLATLAGDAAFASGVSSLPLPDNFPKDVYLPARYTVDSVFDMGGTAMVAMSAPGRVTVLFADARSMMRAQGWTQTMAAQHSVDNAVLAFEKDQRNATLSFNRAQGEDAPRDGVVVSVQLRESLQGDSGAAVAHGF
jgi:hypothetical protein